MNIHNMDMSQEAPMMPVYMPIIEEHHGVMFTNSSKSINDTYFTHILSNMDSHEELMAHEVNDMETFVYRDQLVGSNTPMVEAVYLIDTRQRKYFLTGKCMLNLNMMKAVT